MNLENKINSTVLNPESVETLRRPDNRPDKQVTIFIDSRPYVVEKNQLLSYEDIVRMWQGSYVPSDGVTYIITFSRGHSDHAKGELLPGENLKAKEGMVINVGRANRS